MKNKELEICKLNSVFTIAFLEEYNKKLANERSSILKKYKIFSDLRLI